MGDESTQTAGTVEPPRQRLSEQDLPELCIPWRTWELVDPARKAWIAAIPLLVGGIALAVGLWLVPYRWLFLFISLGGFCYFVGLLFLHDACHDWFEEQGSAVPIVAGVAIVGYVAGGACLVLGVVLGSGLLALIGALLGSAALAAMAAGMRVFCRSRAVPCALGGAGLALVFLVVAAAAPNNDVIPTVAVLLFVPSLVLGVIGVQRLCTEHPEEGLLFGADGVVLGLLFLGLLLWRTSEPPPILIAVSVLVIGLGLLLLSRSAPGLVNDSNNPGRFRYASWFAFGAAAAALITLIVAAEWPWQWSLAVALLFVVIVWAMVFNGAALSLVLVVGVALAFVVTDRSDTWESPAPEAALRLVALGDSYISGEGAHRYFEGTSVAGEDGDPDKNECRVARTAYSYLVAEELGLELDFIACSGANTWQIAATGETVNDKEAKKRDQKRKQAGAALGLACAGNVTQVDCLKSLERDDVAAVLVSVGGNDAWFGEITASCLAPESCAVHKTVAYQRVAEIGDYIFEVHTAVKEAVGDGIPIVAMPYPIPTAYDGCLGSPLTTSDHEFVYEFASSLNEQVRASADRAGILFYDDGITAFEGHQICNDDEGALAANAVHVNPKEGSLLERANPTNWFHGMAHPNEIGHRLTACGDTDPDACAGGLAAYLSERLPSEGEEDAATEPPPPVSASGAGSGFDLSLQRVVVVRSLELAGLAESHSDAPAIRQLGFSATVKPVPLPGFCTEPDSCDAISPGETTTIEYTIENREPNSAVFWSQPDGSWHRENPSSSTGADGVTVDVESWTYEEAEGKGRSSQVVVSQASGGAWEVMVFEYCALDPDCRATAEDVKAWTASQIRNTALLGVVPLLLVFAGAWFGAVETRRLLLADGGT